MDLSVNFKQTKRINEKTNSTITVRIIYIVEEKTASIVRKKGGRPDSNRRPPEPQSGVLTN